MCSWKCETHSLNPPPICFYSYIFDWHQFAGAFWTGIALVGVWYALMIAPIVREAAGRHDAPFDFHSARAYILPVRFLSTSAYLPLLVNVLKVLQCTANSSGVDTLAGQPSMVCDCGCL